MVQFGEPWYPLLSTESGCPPKVKHSIIWHEQSIPWTMEWNFTPPLTHCIVWPTDPGHPPRIWILDIFELARERYTEYMYIYKFDFGNISSQFSRLCMCWAFGRRAANPWSDLHPGDIKKSIGEWLPFTSDRKRRRTKPLACWLEIGWHPKMKNCKCECIAPVGAEGQLGVERYKSVQKQAAFSCSIELLTQQEKVALEWPR